MTTLREAAQQVLDAWQTATYGHPSHHKATLLAMTALKAALAEPQSTHSADCYQWHHKCAIAEVERLRAALAEPVQEPVSVTDLQQALVETNLIDPDAIDDPEGWDYGSTVAQIDALHEMLFKSQRKPLTEEEIEMAYREIWRDLPTDFYRTSFGWIEQGIRYAERAHGIGEAK